MSWFIRKDETGKARKNYGRTATHCVIDPKVPMEQYEKLRSSYSLPISCKYVFASELELHSRMG